MSTNYYAVQCPSKEQHKTMEELLHNKQYEELKVALEDTYRSYHIGKRSAGWAFCFQARENLEFVREAQVPWEANIESLKEYLAREDVIIYDEYGRTYTSEQFWNQEVGNSLYVDETHDNLQTYYQKHPEERPYYSSNEFMVDKTRWADVWFA